MLLVDLLRKRDFSVYLFDDQLARQIYRSPDLVTDPIVWPTIVIVVFDFILRRERFVHADVGTVLNLFLRQQHGESLVLPIRLIDNDRRNKHFASRQPATGVSDDVTNRPVLIIEDKIIGFADVTVLCSHGETFEIFHFSQHDATSSFAYRFNPIIRCEGHNSRAAASNFHPASSARNAQHPPTRPMSVARSTPHP